MIAVLWIVAALSIMVTGLTNTVRQEIGVVSTQRDQVTGQAVGEAAMVLALQEISVQTDRVPGIVTINASFAGVDMSVEAAPLNGLISLNGAEVPLFSALFQFAGGMAAGPADALAASLVEWRDGHPEGGGANLQPRRLEAVEDLLLVPGIDYALYTRIAPLVSADLGNTNRVNPEAAPPGVLAVLAQGDVGRANQYMRQRENGQLGADASGLQPGFINTDGSNLYRLRVKVPLEAGKMLILTRDVALGGIFARAAPWRVLRTDRQIVASSI